MKKQSICIILTIIIILQYTKWSDNEHKIIALFIFISFFLIVSGITYSLKEIKILNIVPLFISPLLIIIGLLLGIIPIFIDPSNFSRSYFYWKICIYLWVIYQIIGTFVFQILNAPVNLILSGVVFTIFSVYMIIYLHIGIYLNTCIYMYIHICEWNLKAEQYT